MYFGYAYLLGLERPPDDDDLVSAVDNVVEGLDARRRESDGHEGGEEALVEGHHDHGKEADKQEADLARHGDGHLRG